MVTMNLSKSEALKPVEENAVYTPTLLMEKFVDTAIRLGTDNVAEICRKAKMTEQAYYQWKKDPNFRRWMNEYANEQIRGDAWKLQNIGMRKAKQDHRYWESMQKIVGNIKDDKSSPLQLNVMQSINLDRDKYSL